jgi:hypothetical protein
MHQTTRYGLSLALLGAMGIAGNANALQLSSVEDFCGLTSGTPVDITEGLLTFSCFTGSSTFDPNAPEAAVTNLPGATQLLFDTAMGSGGAQVGTFQISGLSSLTLDDYWLSYFVEITPGGDAAADPELRFTTVGHGADVDSDDDNVGTLKYVVGQNNVIVTDANFAPPPLATTPTSDADTTTCGVCRKFLVTDQINRDFDDSGSGALIFSTSNSFRVAEVPLPSTLLLMGFGLLGAGVMGRRFGAAKNA